MAGPGGDGAAALRLHRELNTRPTRRSRVRAREEEEAGEPGGGQGRAGVKTEEEEEVEEVKVRAVEWWPVKAEPEEDVKIRAVEWAGEGGKRKRVKREGEVVVAEAGPSGQGSGGQQTGNAGRGSSRFRGVNKQKGRKTRPWVAQTSVREDGKRRNIGIGRFAREEDAARAYDRVNIAKIGHAEANTNFPAAEYRAEWAELEALGMEGAAALMREHAAAERMDVMKKASRFRGVIKEKRLKTKPWAAQIKVTEDGKSRLIYLGTFAREEDAARAYDRVNIAKVGHAEAKTNFPAAEYRAEWAELEALGVEGVVALMKDHATAERVDLLNKTSRYRGVSNNKSKKASLWKAQIYVTADGKTRQIFIGRFAREEDAARAYDRANIAKLGHAQAKTNFPVAEYRAQWKELEALGASATVARERQRARKES